MYKKIITSLCLILLCFSAEPGLISQLGANSLLAIRNPNKKIELNYNNQSIEIELKTLKNRNQLTKILSQSILKDQNLDTNSNTRVEKVKGRYQAIEGQKNYQIDIDHLKLASLSSDSIDVQVKPIPENYSFEEAQEQANKLNKVRYQTLRINDGLKTHEFQIDPLELFIYGSNNINLYKLKELIGEFEKNPENLTSNLYIDSVTGLATGFIKNGKRINYEQTAKELQTNFDAGLLKFKVVYDEQKGLVIDENGKAYIYEKQGEGKSNFKGSDWGRSQNVELGTQNIISHVLVMPQQQISFLDLLKTRGYNIDWKLAKVIKEGGKLELEPGGGLCQVSTTLFRAALQSGMNIDQWRNHSLYVSYYKEYNNGLDSTIYPPYVDLKFTNPYNFPVIFQSYTNEDKDVITEFYSPLPTSKVELLGPYYQGDKDGLRWNQILWERKIDRMFYTETQEFKSTYNTSVSR